MNLLSTLVLVVFYGLLSLLVFSALGHLSTNLTNFVGLFVCVFTDKAVATRPFDVGPSNFHTMTSLGSHGACESFNEKGNNFF